MQKSGFDQKWERLAGAAFDTRDSLRRMAPRLDAALLDDGVAASIRVLIEDVRAIAGRHAMLLTLALKDPAGGDRAQNGRISRGSASSGIDPGVEGERYQPAARRALWARR
jgi:hypothetical protein